MFSQRIGYRETKKGSIAIGHRGRIAITILPYVESKSVSPLEDTYQSTPLLLHQISANTISLLCEKINALGTPPK